MSHHFLRPISSEARCASLIALLPQDASQTSQIASGYLLGVLEHQRPTAPFLLDRALAVHLPPPPPAATSLHQWLFSGTWGNLNHLPTHLSTANTGAFCSQVAQVPGNLTPGVKEEANRRINTASGALPCWPQRPQEQKDCMVRWTEPHSGGQHSSRMQNTSPPASFSKQLECDLLYDIFVETKVHCRSQFWKALFLVHIFKCRHVYRLTELESKP